MSKKYYLFAALMLSTTLGCGSSNSPVEGDGGTPGDGRDGGGTIDRDGGAIDDPPRVVAATGQTECYNQAGDPISCSGTGQDGEIRAGVAHPSPRFTDNGDGTVRDHLTGLIWLKRDSCLSAGRVGWSEALGLVAALADGHVDCQLSDGSAAGDWRLPNVRELMSLVSVSNTAGGPALSDGHPFENVQIEMHWTSTSRAQNEDSAWTGSFFQSGRFSSASKAGDAWWVWAMRADPDNDDAPLSLAATNQTACFDDAGDEIDCAGTGQDGEIRAGVPAPPQRFTDNGDGTVTDNLTDLVWLKKADCMSARPFDQALEEAAALADGDCDLADGSVAGDWRIPNYYEFLSLHDFSRFEPQLSDGHPFTDIQNELYWSSTSLSRAGDRNWMMNSFWVNIHGGRKTAEQRSWPVRDR